MTILIEICECPYCEEIIEDLKVKLTHECIDTEINDVIITVSAPCPHCSEPIVFDERFYLEA